MKLHYRLWIVFSLIWLIGLFMLYILIVNIFNERALDNQEQMAFSQGYTITGRVSGLLPSFLDRAEGYLDYYSDLFDARLMLLSSDKQLIYDSFDDLSPSNQLSLSILDDDLSLPTSIFIRTEAFGLIQHTLFPIDHRQTSGYLLMVTDANSLDGDITKFRNQVLMTLGAVTIGSFLVFYVLATLFTRPIRRIMWHLQRVTPQKREFPMRYRGKNEIGQLVKEIKAMIYQVDVYESRQRRFISTSSHELKTPLATMQLIIENLPSLRMNEEMHREYIADLQLQIDKMRRTVQGMLDVYRIADKPLEKEQVTFSHIRRYIDDHLLHIAENKNIQLVYDHDVTSLYVDADLFLRGLDNLVSNAIRYSNENAKIEISLRRHGTGRIVCSVCDQGIGIADKDIPYVFEPFYRSNEAMGWSQEGSGLGLAIVKQMIDLHGADVEVKSKLGKGTCINLIF